MKNSILICFKELNPPGWLKNKVLNEGNTLKRMESILPNQVIDFLAFY